MDTNHNIMQINTNQSAIGVGLVIVATVAFICSLVYLSGWYEVGGLAASIALGAYAILRKGNK